MHDKVKKIESDLLKKCKKPKDSLSNNQWKDKLNLTRFKNKEMSNIKEGSLKIWDDKKMPNLESKRNQRKLLYNQKRKKENCHYLNKLKSNANKSKLAITLTHKLAKHSSKPHKSTWIISSRTMENKNIEKSTKIIKPSRIESVKLSEVLNSCMF